MKKCFAFVFVLTITLIFSGCSLGKESSSKDIGGVRMSTDSGKTWELKNRVADKKNISSVDVLSIAIDPVNSNRIYLGTKKNGILISEDMAESWETFDFPAKNGIYDISIDKTNFKNIYVAGIISGRGKVFRTQDGGEEWTEVYTEPADGTYVTAMAVDDNNPQNIFIGTSAGVILKTSNGGDSWSNLYSSNNAVSKIIISNDDKNSVYFLVYQRELIASDINGDNFRKLRDNESKQKKPPIFSFEIDRNNPGTLYIGTKNGLFKSIDYGESFKEVDIIASSKEFPISAIAVNPFNSSEIIYGSAQAMYKTTNAGKEWSTSQLNTIRNVSDIKFNLNDPNIVFAGFRSFK